MGYADFEQSSAHTSKQPGAGLQIVLVDVESGAEFTSHTGMSSSSNFERIPIREAGESHPSEIADGYAESNVSLDAYFTAALNDTYFPNEQDFIGREYNALRRIPPNRPGAGNVVDAVIGYKPASCNIQQGNSDVVRASMSGPCLYRMSGKQYATMFGKN